MTVSLSGSPGQQREQRITAIAAFKEFSWFQHPARRVNSESAMSSNRKRAMRQVSTPGSPGQQRERKCLGMVVLPHRVSTPGSPGQQRESAEDDADELHRRLGQVSERKLND